MALFRNLGVGPRTIGCTLVWGAALFACSPALNWRDVGLLGSDAKVLFPCKPTTEVRTVHVSGIKLAMSMLACQADGATYAVAMADVGEPGQIGNVLAAWRAAQLKNLDATQEELSPVSLMGASAGVVPLGRHRLKGRFPDGTPAQQDLMFVAQGTKLFQVAVLSSRVDTDAAAFFFGSLHWTQAPPESRGR